MGKTISKIWQKYLKNKESRIIMIGLDAAGKTTILYKLKLGEVVETIPTIGFNVEQIEYHNVSLTVWDCGWQRTCRPLWRVYFKNARGLIFVVDSHDRDRINDARIELQSLLDEEQLMNVEILILANKQDLPNAMNTDEIINKLELYGIRGRNWYIQKACAITGEGLLEGLDWLACALTSKKSG